MNKPTNPQVGTKYRAKKNYLHDYDYKKGHIVTLVMDGQKDDARFSNKKGQEFWLRWQDLEPLEKTFDTLEAGDVVVDRDGDERTVLERLGNIIFVSGFNSPEVYGNGYTAQQLKGNGYTIKQSSEVKELTLDEIAEKFGLPVEQIRIKKEDR